MNKLTVSKKKEKKLTKALKSQDCKKKFVICIKYKSAEKCMEPHSRKDRNKYVLLFILNLNFIKEQHFSIFLNHFLSLHVLNDLLNFRMVCHRRIVLSEN